MKTLLLCSAFAFIAFAIPQIALAQSAEEDIRAVCQTNPSSSLCVGLKEGSDDANDGNPVIRILTSAINILSFLTGFLTVFFVIFGGFKYITSGGDSGKVTSAKNTIVYALVGLVVVVISRQLILFILSQFT